MQHLAAHPHNVGTTYDKENAEWIAAKFKEFGLDTHIEQFDVLFPTPKERAVELVEGGPKFVAKLQEPAIPQDPTSSQQSEQLPTYNAYSIDGDVTAPLVYVNYGIPEDYEQLERMGVSVKGKIVIARYYHSWRGIKPKVAAEHGAVGCLIYSDPHEDGFVQGETFPAGAWRPQGRRAARQRRRHAVLSRRSADARAWAPRKTPSASRSKTRRRSPKFPCCRFPTRDAQPLLAALTGRLRQSDWRGGLGQTYRIGPGPAKVHLKVKSNWDIKPVYDVIAKIPGSAFPDEWVIRGNHHDGWVNGAEDPISGMDAVLEEGRALGELLKQGWKPKRTIILCAWDGEEPGLLGSTEWAEEHADELRAARRGLHQFRHQQPRLSWDRRLAHPRKIHQRGLARHHRSGNEVVGLEAQPASRNRHRRNPPSSVRKFASAATCASRRLGSGSDFTAFLQHDGVASLNIGFGGEDGGGIYHSIYDDYYWYTHFSDGDFVYGRALAQAGGSMVMRLADADLLPFEFGDFSDTMQTYVKELKALSQKMRDDIVERNREIEEGVFSATNDPRTPLVAPSTETVPTHLNFAPLDDAVDALARSAAEYHKALEHANANGGAALASASLAEVNQLLIESERKLTNTEGLPNRPWFKHQIYAPGFYTGYAVKTIPAVREAIELKQWKQADTAIVVVAQVLQDEAALISSAASKLAATSHRWRRRIVLTLARPDPMQTVILSASDRMREGPQVRCRDYPEEAIPSA